MASDPSRTPHDGDWPISNPWPALLIGLALTGAALLWRLLLAHTSWGNFGTPFRAFLIVAGTISAGLGVTFRLQASGQELAERLRSALVLCLAGFVALLGNLALNVEWEATCLLFRVLVGVALGGAVLVLLPSVARRVVLVLAVAAHFLGIFTQIASIPPGGLSAQPWITAQLSTYVFRDYLQFMYLTNAYHFYSPDPGPPTLLLFRVEYADRSYRWIWVPNRKDHRTRIEYQRRLGLTASIEHTDPSVALLDQKVWEFLKKRRQQRGIPFASLREEPQASEYLPPTSDSKMMLDTYALYGAHAYPSLDNPALEVTGVRVYRVVHRILEPTEMIDRPGFPKIDPYNPRTYLPYYEGEYDTKGHLKDPDDPFLYWLMPVVPGAKLAAPADFDNVDFLAPPEEPS